MKKLRFLIAVTKETQARLGVEFTLTATRVSETAVIVQMEVPRKGKLRELKEVALDIGDYRPGSSGSPLVSANLQTTPGKNGALVVSFQISPELAEKCSIRLGPLYPAVAMSWEYYAVMLKGYITERK